MRNTLVKRHKNRTQILYRVTRLTFVNFTFIMYHITIMPQNRIRIVDVADTLGLSSMASKESNPSLTTIHQEANLRAKTAIECLEAMRDGADYKTEIVLPVDVIKRESTRKL